MPINWKAPETLQRLMAATIASLDMPNGGKLDYHNVAAIFGQGASYDAIESRFRTIRREAEVLKQEAVADKRINASGVRTRSVRKPGAVPNAVQVGTIGSPKEIKSKKNAKPTTSKRKRHSSSEEESDQSAILSPTIGQKPKRKSRPPPIKTGSQSKRQKIKSPVIINELERKTALAERTPASTRSRKEFIEQLKSATKPGRTSPKMSQEDDGWNIEDRDYRSGFGSGSSSGTASSPCPVPNPTLRGALGSKGKGKGLTKSTEDSSYL